MSHPVRKHVLEQARKLKFPYLFGVTVVLLLIDLLIPDPFPFVDELLLGLLALLLGTWRQRRKQPKKTDRATITPAKTSDAPDRR